MLDIMGKDDAGYCTFGWTNDFNIITLPFKEKV